MVRKDKSEIVLPDSTKQKIQQYVFIKGEFDNYMSGIIDALGLDGTWQLDMDTLNLVSEAEFERRARKKANE